MSLDTSPEAVKNATCVPSPLITGHCELGAPPATGWVTFVERLRRNDWMANVPRLAEPRFVACEWNTTFVPSSEIARPGWPPESALPGAPPAPFARLASTVVPAAMSRT